MSEEDAGQPFARPARSHSDDRAASPIGGILTAMRSAPQGLDRDGSENAVKRNAARRGPGGENPDDDGLGSHVDQGDTTRRESGATESSEPLAEVFVQLEDGLRAIGARRRPAREPGR
jgi:hypothetical protein